MYYVMYYNKNMSTTKITLKTLAKVALSILELPRADRPYILGDEISAFDAVINKLREFGYSLDGDMEGTDEEYSEFLKHVIYILEQN